MFTIWLIVETRTEQHKNMLEITLLVMSYIYAWLTWGLYCMLCIIGFRLFSMVNHHKHVSLPYLLLKNIYFPQPSWGVFLDDGWFKQWDLGAGRDCTLEAHVKPAISAHTQGEISCTETWSPRSFIIIYKRLQQAGLPTPPPCVVLWRSPVKDTSLACSSDVVSPLYIPVGVRSVMYVYETVGRSAGKTCP